MTTTRETTCNTCNRPACPGGHRTCAHCGTALVRGDRCCAGERWDRVRESEPAWADLADAERAAFRRALATGDGEIVAMEIAMEEMR